MSNEIDKKVKGYLDRATNIFYGGTPEALSNWNKHLLHSEQGQCIVEIAKMIQLEEKLYDKELAVNLKKWASFELYRASQGENNE